MAKPIEIFRQMDEDESGHITYEELRTGLLDILNLSLTDEEFESILDKFVNKNLFGKIEGRWEPKFNVGEDFSI